MRTYIHALEAFAEAGTKREAAIIGLAVGVLLGGFGSVGPILVGLAVGAYAVARIAMRLDAEPDPGSDIEQNTERNLKRNLETNPEA